MPFGVLCTTTCNIEVENLQQIDLQQVHTYCKVITFSPMIRKSNKHFIGQRVIYSVQSQIK
jgi:hypothetical protein